MKKNIPSLLVSFILTLSIFSCQDDASSVKPAMHPTTIKSADAGSLGQTLICTTAAGNVYSYVGTAEQQVLTQAVLDSHPETPYDGFDLSQVYYVQATGTKRVFVYSSLNNTSATQRVLAIFDLGTESAHPMIIETTSQSVEYIDYTKEQKTTVVNGPNGVEATTTNLSNTAARLLPCGQATASCIQDAYSNHGWISVWAFVQTAFIPWTAVGIAAGCAINNC